MHLSGTPTRATYEKVTNTFVLERASVSTFPFAIDDPAKAPTKLNDISDVVVDLYNGGRTPSLRRGAVVAKSNSHCSSQLPPKAGRKVCCNYFSMLAGSYTLAYPF